MSRGVRGLMTVGLAVLVALSGAACEKEEAGPIEPPPLAKGEFARIKTGVLALTYDLVVTKDRLATHLRSRKNAVANQRNVLENLKKKNSHASTIARYEQSVKTAEKAEQEAFDALQVVLLGNARKKTGDWRLEEFFDKHERCKPFEQQLALLKKRFTKLSQQEARERRTAAQLEWSESNRRYDIKDRRDNKIVTLRRRFDRSYGNATYQFIRARTRLRRVRPVDAERYTKYEAELKRIRAEVYEPAAAKFREADPEQWALLRSEEEAIPQAEPTERDLDRAMDQQKRLAAAKEAHAATTAQLEQLERLTKAWEKAFRVPWRNREIWRPHAESALLDHWARR